MHTNSYTNYTINEMWKLRRAIICSSNISPWNFDALFGTEVVFKNVKFVYWVLFYHIHEEKILRMYSKQSWVYIFNGFPGDLIGALWVIGPKFQSKLGILLPTIINIISFNTIFCSGLLVMYTNMSKKVNNNGKTNWFKYYFHRFWR